MSFEQQHRESMERRYGLKALQTDTEMHYGEPASNQTVSRWHSERISYLKKKYFPKAGGLELVGYASPKQEGTTVAEMERLRGIQEARGECIYCVKGEGLNSTPQKFYVAVRF